MEWDEIKSEVEQQGNVITLSMEQLRNAAGASRLGVNVREEISSTLAGMGLGHIPVDLPAYHYEQVRLYKRGTAVGKMIDIMLEPGEQNDRQLTDRLGGDGPDYAAIVERVRELVNE
ncbi:hypothetical protein [Billgrantia endophytica]|uniref:Uncharacterized protein n=1 Tax=Billgrantia endophytica TaxID=2033802 RepID=A0A2N7U0W4_9GAMM|nr:hypothetical protein [Halomonas endophytica]PMR74053.1 hypothetical protein C1H69_15400 [Halomonas endophytica]